MKRFSVFTAFLILSAAAFAGEHGGKYFDIPGKSVPVPHGLRKKDYSTGQRAGAGFLNLAFGAGEFFLMNNRKAALGFLIADVVGYGTAIGLFVAESKLTWEDNRDIIGVPGTIGFCVAGTTLLGTGIAGFILPFRDHASGARVSQADFAGQQPFAVTIVPANRGGGAVSLSYTWRK